jgi:hypothetical protein
MREGDVRVSYLSAWVYGYPHGLKLCTFDTSRTSDMWKGTGVVFTYRTLPLPDHIFRINRHLVAFVPYGVSDTQKSEGSCWSAGPRYYIILNAYIAVFLQHRCCRSTGDGRGKLVWLQLFVLMGIWCLVSNRNSLRFFVLNFVSGIRLYLNISQWLKN